MLPYIINPPVLLLDVYCRTGVRTGALNAKYRGQRSFGLPIENQWLTRHNGIIALNMRMPFYGWGGRSPPLDTQYIVLYHIAAAYMYRHLSCPMERWQLCMKYLMDVFTIAFYVYSCLCIYSRACLFD